MNKNKGITLIALIITIIILLILAGITIGTLTGENGLFTRAQQAKEKTQESQERENETIENYIAQIDEISDENTLVNKVKSGEIKIGDYVKYEPNSVDINSDEYKTLVSNWGETYSGSTNNSSANLIQDKTLNWRVLDIKDGKVRLISDKPTSNTVALSGYQGYNNAVYLLDHTCKTLYSNSTLSNNVQNLKIEDIQNKLKENYMKLDTEYGKIFEATPQYYAEILNQEKEQSNIINKETAKGTLGVSEQNTLINQEKEESLSSLKLKRTFWNKKIDENDFIDNSYYELFIKKKENKEYYSKYWLASRSVHDYSSKAIYGVQYIDNENVTTFGLYHSNQDVHDNIFTFRPVITLNTEVKIDTEETRDGNSAETAYVLK